MTPGDVYETDLLDVMLPEQKDDIGDLLAQRASAGWRLVQKYDHWENVGKHRRITLVMVWSRPHHDTRSMPKSVRRQ